MIGSLQGKVEVLAKPHSIINVSGVGYRVFLYETLYSKLTLNQDIKLFTYTHVKEDALELFGFLSIDDLRLFENLITVSGIGPKTAINIFSYGKREDIISAIISADVSFFTSVPRLGKKNAQKLIIELKNKLGSIDDLDLTNEDRADETETIEALRSFGFSAKEARDAVRQTKTNGQETQERVRIALKYLGERR